MPDTGTARPAARSGIGDPEPPAARAHRRAGTNAARRRGRAARRTRHRRRCRTAWCGSRSTARSRGPPVRFHSTQESTVPNARSSSASTPPSREQPLELGGREVRVEHQPGARPYERLDARDAQLVAARRGAAVLPDDRPVAGAPGRAVPHDHRLPLVGDPDRGDGPVTEARDHLGQGVVHRPPDVVGIVLDPARSGEVLGELPVGEPRPQRRRRRRPPCARRWCRRRWRGRRPSRVSAQRVGQRAAVAMLTRAELEDVRVVVGVAREHLEQHAVAHAHQGRGNRPAPERRCDPDGSTPRARRPRAPRRRSGARRRVEDDPAKPRRTTPSSPASPPEHYRRCDTLCPCASGS